jgi:hypothetical protein
MYDISHQPTKAKMSCSKPFDVYEGDDGVKIMCFKTDETHFAETQIFKYYDEKKWWLKHKTDDYFLLIETKPKKKKKIILLPKKKEEEEAEEEKRDWWGTHGDGVVHLKYATEEYMDINFEEWGAFEGLIDTREEEEEILLTCFKCEKKYMGVEGNCCCGKCCSYCT